MLEEVEEAMMTRLTSSPASYPGDGTAAQVPGKPYAKGSILAPAGGITRVIRVRSGTSERHVQVVIGEAPADPSSLPVVFVFLLSRDERTAGRHHSTVIASPESSPSETSGGVTGQTVQAHYPHGEGVDYVMACDVYAANDRDALAVVDSIRDVLPFRTYLGVRLKNGETVKFDVIGGPSEKIRSEALSIESPGPARRRLVVWRLRYTVEAYEDKSLLVTRAPTVLRRQTGSGAL